MKSTVQGTLVLTGVLLSTGVVFPGQQDPSRETTSAVSAGEQPAVPGPNGRRFEPQGVVVYNNGPLITHPGGGAGGADASALQTAMGMNVFGYTVAVSSNFRLADDFTVPAGQSWRIDSATFFAYQTNSPTSPSTFNHADVQIWNGPPNNPASMVVFGDMATNRLANSVWSNIYRVLDTSLTNTQRPVMANTANIGVTLPAGTYWIDWRLGGTGASGPFAPPITILGQTSTGNAMQRSPTGTWTNLVDVGPQGMPFILEAFTPVAAALAVDAPGNGVLQPNEVAVVVAPSWRNPEAVAMPNVTGILSNFTGPVGPIYTINDNMASYGTIPAATTQSCGSNCYAVTVTSATRPDTHWDSSALETVMPGAVTKTWVLHVGDSFTDVPPTNAFYRFVETILHKNVTGGCTATAYCPANSTTRGQMAVFVLVSKEPPGYTPVACVAGSEMFADVPASSPFCRWVEELARRGVVAGCGGGNYCPNNPVTREQMAIFVLRTLDPALNPPACGTPVFNDVPASSPFCRWIEELVRRGVVTGCGGGNYCPTASVTRGQMSVFLAVTFALVLYGL
jgi:hypothetical protein